MSAVDCTICATQKYGGHWRWHTFCQGELNPVGLVAKLRSMPQTDEVKQITAYVVGVTGMDESRAMKAIYLENKS
jgi:hypothetical protein